MFSFLPVRAQNRVGISGVCRGAEEPSGTTISALQIRFSYNDFGLKFKQCKNIKKTPSKSPVAPKSMLMQGNIALHTKWVTNGSPNVDSLTNIVFRKF